VLLSGLRLSNTDSKWPGGAKSRSKSLAAAAVDSSGDRVLSAARREPATRPVRVSPALRADNSQTQSGLVGGYLLCVSGIVFLHVVGCCRVVGGGGIVVGVSWPVSCSRWRRCRRGRVWSAGAVHRR
jgi:hypothetical protein